MPSEDWVNSHETGLSLKVLRELLSWNRGRSLRTGFITERGLSESRSAYISFTQAYLQHKTLTRSQGNAGATHEISHLQDHEPKWATFLYNVHKPRYFVMTTKNGLRYIEKRTTILKDLETAKRKMDIPIPNLVPSDLARGTEEYRVYSLDE